ncbi:uncharacterized protein LOC111411033 isoform X2 [Olea europaea var. sylvestris]|uniref:uncharacterized protein LOC111411033 isoform X2 n=1 Tax=Olea europaea var. sylvestris TaxID=158386 RepID=UPI000C1D1478|nr:uncharacterized protein LOC111411033 isoform X2 [Olea europaea var. sylvestris]
MKAQVSSAEVRRLHVVYFLSRSGGGVEHPHLVPVHHLSSNGVRLRDIKKWLAELRGKDMPESFAWSYKRKYRTGYIWQDLLDDDLVTPITDNEYVLKGSEISSPTSNKDLSYSQKKVTMQEEPLTLEEIKGHKPSCIQIHSEKSMDISSKTPSEIEEESPKFGSETSTFTNDSGELNPKPEPEPEPEPEKNSDTVKQENMRVSTDSKLPRKELRNENPVPSLDSTPSNKDKKKMNNKVPMEKNTKPASSARSFTKSKSFSSGASHIFKNLISCGAVDTNDSAVVTIDRKNRPFLNMCSSDENDVHSEEICKRGSQRTFGTLRNQQQWNGRSCDGEKDSRKQKTPLTAYKQIRGPNCSQCGKSFKPEKLLSHMKYCEGMKALAKGANPAFSASIAQTKSQRPSSKESQNMDSLSGYYITN